jgi:hypothetical protein
MRRGYTTMSELAKPYREPRTDGELFRLLYRWLDLRRAVKPGNPVRVKRIIRGRRRRPSEKRWRSNYLLAKVILYTRRYEIHIGATVDRDTHHTYLSGGFISRAMEPGESWQRGGDLPDGPLTEVTLDDILDSAFRLELVDVAHPHDYLLEEPEGRLKRRRK